MTLLKFYFGFGLFVEYVPILPMLLGIKKWKGLPTGIKFFVGFLVAEVLFNGLTDYYLFALHRKTLFLFYINSFLQSSFVLAMFWCLFKTKREQNSTFNLWCLSFALLVIDFLFVSKMDYNYFSQFCINLLISGLSFYYFYTTFPTTNLKKYLPNETELIISAALVLQFFFKIVNIFLEKFLLETQYNAILNIQTRNVNAYFTLLALLIYAYAFYKFKANEI